jgi:hypothetical protein
VSEIEKIEKYVPGWRWDDIYLLWISGWLSREPIDLRCSLRVADGDGGWIGGAGGIGNGVLPNFAAERP